jgi:Ca-activated chloride channel family protein
MRQIWITSSLLVTVLFGKTWPAEPQTRDPANKGTPQYSLSVATDEVIVSFHAVDADGRSINDIKFNELELLDDGKPPLKILAFESPQDLPIRAGILMDMSESMDEARFKDREVAINYIQQLFRQQSDQAFVINFGQQPTIAQAWTNDTSTLIDGIRNRNVKATGGGRIGGTAIFDAIYRACRYQFSQIDYASSGNFVLLFADGQDNASHFTLQEAVDACNSTNTAIYVFRAETELNLSSPGPKTLADLATLTGGRVFRDEDSKAGAYGDLQIIQADLRNQYRLVYKPADLKHDGSFHRITLAGPQRAESIHVRSGYYAPTH